MNLEKCVNKAETVFKELTGKPEYMDVEFLMGSLYKEYDFFKYILSLLRFYDVSAEKQKEIPFSSVKYIESYMNIINAIDTEEKRKKYYEDRTKIFNAFLLFLITQSKLVAKDEMELACIITIEHFGKATILGSYLRDLNITREKILEFDQSYKISNLIENKLASLTKKDKQIKEDLETVSDETNEQFDEVVDNIKESQILETYFEDYSTFLKFNKTNKLIGQESNIKTMEQALIRKNKTGVVITGQSGVGKDELINGFTKNLKNSNFFKAYSVIKLNTTSLSESSLLRGQLEAKVKELTEFISKFSDVILYIENFQTLFTKLRIEEDVAHVLLPSLMKNRVKIIASCDYDSWTNIAEDNPEIAKYFYEINIKEPTIEETINIVKKNLKSYTDFYKIKIESNSINKIVQLADRYIFNRAFPEKAFDLLDLILAKAKCDNLETLSNNAVEKLFSEMQNIPLDKVSVNDLIDFKTIANNIKSVVISQDDAIDQIMKYIAINKAGLRESNKTVCNIFLKSQSGVGKTFICQQLAKELNIKLVRFDMSEYSEPHSVAKFLGTPPGYVGFNDANHGSLLLSAIEQNPRCVLLLDEIEKANETIHNVLLQAMDNGKLTSSSGKEVSLKEVILMMTSNVGATATEAISFGNSNLDTSMEHMDEIFKPEFKTRLDTIITLNPVSKIDVKKVIELELSKINDMIKKYKKKITWDKNTINYIEKQVKDNNLGLRIIKHIIDSDIKFQIVEKLQKQGNLKIVMENNQLKVK